MRLHSSSIHLQNSVQFRNVANSTGEYLSVIGTRNGPGLFSSKEVAFDEYSCLLSSFCLYVGEVHYSLPLDKNLV